MRFAIAAAILAQGLPATSSESSSKAVSPASRASNSFTKQVLEIVEGLGLETAPRGKFLGLLQEKKKQSGGFIKNSEQPKLQECDPESEEEADTGVLSCGDGTFCAESGDSAKGGFCVTSPDELDRSLQATVSLFDGLYSVFCEPSASYVDDCNCTNADPVAYTLEVVCATPEECTEYVSTCDQNITNCIGYDFAFSLTSPGTYVVDRCFTDSLPYEQATCYQREAFGPAGAEECKIAVDGEDCFSCELSADDEGETCYKFDCTNTISRRAGDTCEDGYVAPMLYYLRTYGCEAYVCPICGGEDFVSTNPGGAIDLGDGITTCAAVAQVALLGGFNETFCQDVVIPGVATPCGCVAFGSPPVEGPTLAPVAPTEAPTATGSAFPTISPITVTFPPTSATPTFSAASSTACAAAGF
ncbi:MAG: hypothetical protein SGILL_009733, partial [Bacillariaceae sp.]